MVREMIVLDAARRMNDIQLEYDKDQFEVEYVKDLHKIILRRKKDQKVLKIIGDNIGFLIEHDIDGDIHFVISDANHYEKKGNRLKHYKLFDDGLYLRSKEAIDDTRECACRIKDHYYIVNQQMYGGKIYNLKTKSNFHNFIHGKKEIFEQFKEPTILVTDIHTQRQIQDEITYGINLDTFDVVTPIYSKLQQRMIPLITEDVWHRPLSLDKKGPATISKEIISTLERLAYNYLEEESELYQQDGQVNQEFVRKFTKTK